MVVWRSDSGWCYDGTVLAGQYGDVTVHTCYNDPATGCNGGNWTEADNGTDGNHHVNGSGGADDNVDRSDTANCGFTS